MARKSKRHGKSVTPIAVRRTWGTSHSSPQAMTQLKHSVCNGANYIYRATYGISTTGAVIPLGVVGVLPTVVAAAVETVGGFEWV